MVNRLIFDKYSNMVDNSYLINTQGGHRLLKLLAHDSLSLSQVRDKFPGTAKELMTTLSQFINTGMVSNTENKIAMTLPVITGQEQEEYLKAMEPAHWDLIQRIDTFIHSSFYQDRLTSLVNLMDYNLIDLNFLLVSCFGMLWGGRTLFQQLADSGEPSTLILFNSRDMGLCQSMSSYTDTYTFSSFGYAENVFRDTLGNLLNQKTMAESLKYLASEDLQNEYMDVIHHLAGLYLNIIGDSLLSYKEGDSQELGHLGENGSLRSFLGSLSYINGESLLIPLFTTNSIPLLTEITQGFQQVLARWYLEKGCTTFVLKGKDQIIDPGLSWLLQIGQVNAYLLQENLVFFPDTLKYRSMVFACPIEQTRAINHRYRWEECWHERS